MSRRYTRRGTALLLVLALLVSMLGAALPVLQKSGAASGTFAAAYTALLEKAPVAQADLERDPYGLNPPGSYRLRRQGLRRCGSGGDGRLGDLAI